MRKKGICDGCSSRKILNKVSYANVCRNCYDGVRNRLEEDMEAGKRVDVKAIIRKKLSDNDYFVSDYTLRDIPKKFWNDVKKSQIDNDISSIRELIFIAVYDYMDRNNTA